MKEGKVIIPSDLKPVERITFRVPEVYQLLVAKQARAANMHHNKLARLALMGTVDSGLIPIHSTVAEMQIELKLFRQEFKEACIDIE